MSHNKHTESAYATRNNIAGKGHKGLVNQHRTHAENRVADEALEIGEGNVLLDRYLGTKVGTPESRAAMAVLKGFRKEKVSRK